MTDRAPFASDRPAPWLWALGVGICFLLLRTWWLYDPYLIVDDAYISFRYADHLSQGLGLVFNAGERVEGYTSLLWVLLLAAGAAAGWSLEAVAVVVSALASVGALCLLALAARRLFAASPWRDLLTITVIGLYALLGCSARFVVSGMETVLFGGLTFAGAYLFLLSRRPLAAGCLFALASLTRPEALLYWGLTSVAALPVWRAERSWPAIHGWRRRTLWSALPLMVTLVAHTAWRLAYYGRPLPNTYYVKAGDPSWERIERGFSLLVEVFAAWAIPLLLLLAVLSVISVRRHPLLRLAWLSGLATTAYFVYVGGDLHYFFGPRFFWPVLPFFLLAVAEGVRLLLAPWRSLAGRRREVPLAAASLAVVLLLGYTASTSWPADERLLHSLAAETRALHETARWLEPRAGDGDVLATPAAGILPYHTALPTIDMYGLNDAHIAQLPAADGGAGKVAHEKYDAAYVLDRRPTWVLTSLSRYGRPLSAGLSEVQYRFRRCYELAALVRVPKEGPPADGESWVLSGVPFRRKLWLDGYSEGLFQRRPRCELQARGSRSYGSGVRFSKPSGPSRTRSSSRKP